MKAQVLHPKTKNNVFDAVLQNEGSIIRFVQVQSKHVSMAEYRRLIMIKVLIPCMEIKDVLYLFD